MRAAITAIAAALALAACGSGSSSSSGHTTAAPAQAGAGAASTTAPARNSAADHAATTTGPVRARLRAPNHDPVAKRNWPYSVVAHGADGRPLTGTVDIQFVYGGQVVGRDTPPTHPLTHGRWHDNLQFPAASIGVPLTFQVVVHTPRGTVTLDWPVKVKS
jgi:hypothetical protein